MYNVDYTALEEKWKPLLEAEGCKPVKDKQLRAFTALMLENQYNNLRENGLINEANYTGMTIGTNYPTDGSFHKIAIPMIRRTFPELVAHDLVGVQPMAGPTGLAFALRFRAGQTYNSGSNTELGYNTIDPTYSGSYATSAGEQLGSNAVTAVNGYPGIYGGLGIGTGQGIKEVNLTLEKAQVNAQTRKLKSRWSTEVAQDLRAMHGLDIEKEMMDILAYEITAEIDREIMANIRTAAGNNSYSHVAGQAGTLSWTSSGDFDGRWEAEKYRNLFNRIIRDANKIAILTRRGAGNFICANPTVSASLEATSSFTIAPVAAQVNTALTGVSKIGSLDGRFNLYRDTFATADEYVVGYKGPSIFDAGIIYLPYVQLMFSKATLEESFNPSIGVQTRYGLMANMFGSNLYYIRAVIENMP
ncbi:MAG: hypothetical protein VB122_00320 [Erysipelotrichales bacterium]|nr:hypothetical protein [Erysipelotrichales bacterium]